MDESVLICKHILGGTKTAFVGNDDAHLVATCGRSDCLSLDGRLEQLTLVSSDWFDQMAGLFNFLSGVPLNAAGALREDGVWEFDIFPEYERSVELYDILRNCRITPTRSEFQEIAPEKLLYLNLLRDNSPAVARDSHGIRFIPVFLDITSAEREKASDSALTKTVVLDEVVLETRKPKPHFLSIFRELDCIQYLIPLNYLKI